MTRALIAAILVAAFPAGPAAAQAAEPPGCVYDPAQGRFRAYAPDADQALVRETLAGRDSAESRKVLIDGVAYVDGRRFEATDPLRDAPDGLNAVLRDKGLVAGVRFFGVADPYADRLAALAIADNCALQLYEYRPVLHGAWVEERPFQFRYPALAVDRASFRQDGGISHAIGFLMRAHPHADDDDPTLYRRLTVAADCAAQTATVVDERGYGPAFEAITRYTPSAAAMPFAEITQPALKVLVRLACEPPADWPEGTRLKDGLDPFSEMVHAAAHAQPAG